MAKIHRKRVDWTGVSVNAHYDPKSTIQHHRHRHHHSRRKYPHVSLAEKRHIDRGFYGDAAVGDIIDNTNNNNNKNGAADGDSSSSSSTLPVMRRGEGGIRLWRRGRKRTGANFGGETGNGSGSGRGNYYAAESYTIPAVNNAKNIAKGETTALGKKRTWRGEDLDYGWTWRR